MKLVVTPPALAEPHDAAAFYTLKANVEFGLAFVAEFEGTANLVLDSPQLGAVFHGTRRRYILRRFPYSIIYQVTAEELRILAVAHHRRRPGYWAQRK
ncbi:MAG: type II toxin-antitoxin system RelE/ParE family toxin [Ferrovum myxofaciens]|uniref:type II toxin-antitoxin system RelE/ParE family toxin n=1 Tax=Ferrovum myxofaciens TaxID=416213 RepID=UPI002357165E|nr:type II toxin-antitoxin system RelE/ParE family toxin [Ferrovum myxofaciens]QKE41725.1 MAG: type II toxin-antitoxin system RelE/ParE family toxin [Ferrovum myxofaciens]